MEEKLAPVYRLTVCRGWDTVRRLVFGWVSGGLGSDSSNYSRTGSTSHVSVLSVDSNAVLFGAPVQEGIGGGQRRRQNCVFVVFLVVGTY